MKRIEPSAFDTKLCRTPNCPEELDAAARRVGRHAGLCKECRGGKGVHAIAHALAREMVAESLRPLPNRRPRNAGFARDRAGEPLSPAELLVLRGIACGLDNAEIGVALAKSEQTVKSQVRSLLLKLEARNRAHAVARAMRNGLLT